MTPYTDAAAELSSCGLYRYTLTRAWEFPATSTVAFVMLNPSKADSTRDDPTIHRCVGFAKSWGHARLVVVNLFAFRATVPRDLYTASEPIGLFNDSRIVSACEAADVVVAAWGAEAGRGAARTT